MSSELVEEKVDLIVSGINGGLNAGINVLYSGTVAAAIEGAFFRHNSFAVSLEYDPHADFEIAADLAVALIEKILARKDATPQLYNINIPTAATVLARQGGTPEVHCVPMGVERYGEHYIRRQDPKGRDYYWSNKRSTSASHRPSYRPNHVGRRAYHCFASQVRHDGQQDVGFHGLVGHF